MDSQAHLIQQGERERLIGCQQNLQGSSRCNTVPYLRVRGQTVTGSINKKAAAEGEWEKEEKGREREAE